MLGDDAAPELASYDFNIIFDYTHSRFDHTHGLLHIWHGNNYTKVKLGPKKVASIRNIEVAAFQGAVFYCHCEVGIRF